MSTLPSRPSAPRCCNNWVRNLIKIGLAIAVADMVAPEMKGSIKEIARQLTKIYDMSSFQMTTAMTSTTVKASKGENDINLSSEEESSEEPGKGEGKGDARFHSKSGPSYEEERYNSISASVEPEIKNDNETSKDERKGDMRDVDGQAEKIDDETRREQNATSVNFDMKQNHTNATEAQLTDQTEKGDSEVSKGQQAELNRDEKQNGTDTVESPLNDQTLPWDPSVERSWLNSTKSNSDPPAMLLLTTFGWNSKNQTEGLELYRGLRMRELVDGIINHPLFYPTAFTDIEEGTMELSNSTRYYVFVDRDTCCEKNYPWYGRGSLLNGDTANRGVCCGCKDVRHQMVMGSKVMSAPNAKFIVFDCGGWGPKSHIFKRGDYPHGKYVFASLSASDKQLNNKFDMGLPPPACRSCELTDEERKAVETCDESNRQFLVSMAAKRRSKAREDLYELNNDADVLMGRGGRDVDAWSKKYKSIEDYLGLAKKSKFSAAPLGDNLFSYRFTEVMSCASIPVIYADGWVAPFGKHLVNWTDAAVWIAEKDANKTIEVLRAITPEQRCLLRKKTLEIYDKYMKTGRRVIAGLIENLELAATD